MNPQEIAELSQMLLKGWSYPEATDDHVAWILLDIKDLPFEETRSFLVKRHRLDKYRPSVPDIRKGVASRLHLLPPSTERALSQAIEWLDAHEQMQYINGSGYTPPPAPNIHPLIKRVMKGIDTTHGSWQSQFRKSYKTSAEAEVDRIISMDFDQWPVANA